MRRAALAAVGQAVALAVLAPYLVMVLTALKPEAELRITPPRLLPVDWRPSNFLAVLRDAAFQDWLRVSLVVATLSTVSSSTWLSPSARRWALAWSSARASRWWSSA